MIALYQLASILQQMYHNRCGTPTARYPRSAHHGRTEAAFYVLSTIRRARNRHGSAPPAQVAMDERAFRATAREPLREQLRRRGAAAPPHYNAPLPSP